MSDSSASEITEAEQFKRSRRVGRFVGIGLSLAIAAAVFAVFKSQPNALAFITVFPVWCWWIPGLIVGAIAWRRASWLARRWLIAAWLVVIWSTSDTPTALLRPIVSKDFRSGRLAAKTELRVVSFNTGSEPPGDSSEMAKWRPDVVLLQETYSRDAVAKLTESLYGDAGEFAWTREHAILARGRVAPIAIEGRELQAFLVAKVRLADGPTLLIANVRLEPQPVRFDFWNKGCWQIYAALRRKHREQLTTLLTEIDRHAGDVPVLIGGDFNAPAGDAIFRLMRPKYSDAFREAGRGWGCTLPNQLPLLRIDQIWASQGLNPRAAWAIESQRSDHRLVVATFEASDRPK